jgi:hypothetical protein
MKRESLTTSKQVVKLIFLSIDLKFSMKDFYWKFELGN